MDWFRHDLNAHDDIKIKKLLKKHGFSALGIYWFLIELICCAGGRLNLNVAIDEVSLIDSLSEKDAEELITNLADMGLVFIEGSMIGSHRSDEEIAYDADRRKKKAEAGKKGMESRWGNRNNVIAEDNNVITLDNTSITDHNTLPNHTLPIKKEEFVSDDTHSSKESVCVPAEKSAAYEGINAHDMAPVFKETFNNIDGVVRCEKITVRREIAVSTILSHFTKDEINKVFEKVSNSTFLKGDNDKGWKVSFDWLFDIDNFTTVLEGKYDQRKSNLKKAEKAEEPTDRSVWTDHDEELKRNEEEFVAKWRAKKHESNK